MRSRLRMTTARSNFIYWTFIFQNINDCRYKHFCIRGNWTMLYLNKIPTIFYGTG